MWLWLYVTWAFLLLKHFILILFCQCPHLCFTQPISRLQLLCSRWPLRFGGCDRGRPVSVSLRVEQWHLTQYPRRIRFLPRSPPSSTSVYLWGVSGLWVRGLLRRKNPCELGHPSPPAPTAVLTCHALVPGWGITVCSLNPAEPSLLHSWTLYMFPVL